MNISALKRCVYTDNGVLIDYPVRPTFCNIPHWAEVTLYVMSVVAIGIFAYGIFRHWKTWMKGQADAPERNTDNPGQRLSNLLRYSFAQRKTSERSVPAVFHGGIYAGFTLLFIGTALATIDWDITRLIFGDPESPLSGRILKGQFYTWYEAVLDGAGLIFLIGLGIAIYRRYVARPHHVRGAWDFVLWSLVFINISGFLIEGLRLYITPIDYLPWAPFSWVGYALASLLPTGDVAKEAFLPVAASAHLWLWLGHAGLSLFFIAALPFTNAIHIITISTNAWFKSSETIIPGAALQPIDLENAPVWGVGQLADMNWKQRLSVDSCVRCGRCETVCPAYMSGTPLNPKQIIVSLSEALRLEVDGAGPFAIDQSNGAVIVGSGLLVDPEALWACTTCAACVQVCPAFIEIVDDIVDMRRYLTLNEGALPGTSANTLKNMGTSGNPWGYAADDRLGWAEGLDIPIATAGEHYEVLYWVGCSASYDQRNQKIARSLVRVMREAGVSFAVMREESCTCESARRLGEEYLYQTATEQNLANMQQYTFDRVVCHCPHCFNTIRNEYPQFGGDFEVVHHSQLIGELLDGGRLKNISEDDAQRVVFHDSCYLGRYNNEFAAPRKALAAAGVQVLEPERKEENGLCCGGGGGKMWFEGAADKDVNIIRMEELLKTKPDAVGVACPFCLTMLDDAAKSLGQEDIKVLDIAEVMAQALDRGEG
jgi:Fe-S oxidoreductase